jgi:hypothetical protein
MVEVVGINSIFLLKSWQAYARFTSYGIKEFCDLPHNFPSFIEVIMTVSKSKTRLPRLPHDLQTIQWFALKRNFASLSPAYK